jgi:hypothetical protein
MSILSGVAMRINPYMFWIKVVATGIIITALTGLWFYGHHYQKKYTIEREAFLTFKTEIKALKVARAAEDKRKAAEAATRAVVNEQIFLALQAKYKTDLDSAKKESDHDKKYIASVVALYSGLRDHRSAGSARVPEVSSTSEVSTEGGSDCNAVLARAAFTCRDTTLKYNTLYKAWVGACDTYGCE